MKNIIDVDVVRDLDSSLGYSEDDEFPLTITQQNETLEVTISGGGCDGDYADIVIQDFETLMCSEDDEDTTMKLDNLYEEDLLVLKEVIDLYLALKDQGKGLWYVKNTKGNIDFNLPYEDEKV